MRKTCLYFSPHHLKNPTRFGTEAIDWLETKKNCLYLQTSITCYIIMPIKTHIHIRHIKELAIKSDQLYTLTVLVLGSPMYSQAAKLRRKQPQYKLLYIEQINSDSHFASIHGNTTGTYQLQSGTVMYRHQVNPGLSQSTPHDTDVLR